MQVLPFILISCMASFVHSRKLGAGSRAILLTTELPSHTASTSLSAASLATELPTRSCAASLAGSPYSFLDKVEQSTEGGHRVYSFVLNVTTPSGPPPASPSPSSSLSPCMDTDLYKVELWSQASCQRAVKAAYVNGRRTTPVFDARSGMWQITNLRMSASSAHGASISLVLDSRGPCPSLDQLCGGSGSCTYSLVNSDRTCCPTGQV